MGDFISSLGQAITAMHGCDCSHLETSTVIEQIEGKTIWSGKVETFDLEGHEAATQAFGWAWEENGEPKYIAVLNVPPINDPSDAVKAAIASGSFK